jgi:hypothetical protein
MGRGMNYFACRVATFFVGSHDGIKAGFLPAKEIHDFCIARGRAARY